jgi:hypothetical protein
MDDVDDERVDVLFCRAFDIFLARCWRRSSVGIPV